MRSRLTKVGAFLTLAAALAVGGATLASASSKAPQSKAPAAVVDTDNIQQGDQSTPDVAGAPAERAAPAQRSLSSSKSAPSKSSSSGPSSTDPSEQPGESSGESSGSEVPGNDGPGGHADEVGTASAPGNAAADHQFQGAE
jgi:hypothetical protein